MSSKLSLNEFEIRPRTGELTALERMKKSHRLVMGKMSLNFGQILPLTKELAALERLKNQHYHLFSVAIDPILFKLGI